MSFRDTLPADARPRFDEAMASFGRAFASARRARDEAYQRGGAQAVAEAAYVPGGKSVTELADGFEELVRQARERRRTAA